MSDDRELIRSRVDLVDLVGQRVSLKKAGASWTGLCPFHDDKHPSFRVNPNLGVYKCWACGASGDLFTWVMATENVDFAEALKILAQIAGVKLKSSRKSEPGELDKKQNAIEESLSYFRSQLAKSSHARDYCRNRGLDEETLDKWEIGYAPDVPSALATHLKKLGHALPTCQDLFLVEKDAQGGYFDKFRGRLMFPIRDDRGRLVAFGGRLLGDGHPKYINSGETPLYNKGRVLYGFHVAKNNMATSKQAVLVEGYLDVMACHRAGVTTAVASLGTSLSAGQVALLKRWCEKVVILYDSDDAGQKAAERACELLSEGGLQVRVALVSSGKDPDTLLREHGPEAVRHSVDNPLSLTAYLLKQLETRKDPGEEEFWDEAAEIIAKAKKHQDVVGIIDALTSKFPFTQDRSVARLSIERMVKAVRARMRKGQPRPEKAPITGIRPGLKGFEQAVFKALLLLDLRDEALQTCRRNQLFVTHDGRRFAEVMSRAFPDGFGRRATREWVPDVPDNDLKSLLEGFELEVLPNRALVLIGQDAFHGAVQRMVDLEEERTRIDLKTSASSDLDARHALLDRIKKAKGGQ
ncbi:MAG: DNA primase [Chthonomonadaceae bacterium]|nr:DNA primase [Chthonomonadaceae bacterium]